MSKFSIAAIAVALGVGLLLIALIPVPTYSVSGNVFICSPTYPGSPAGVPVPGAVISFTSEGGSVYSDETDFDGAYSVSLPTGTYIVHVTRASYLEDTPPTLVVEHAAITHYNEACLVASATG